MANRRRKTVATSREIARDETLHKSSQPVVVPGQLIVRFKPDAVQHAAALVMPRAASARAFAAAVPDEIAGPLTLLREQAGLRAVKPLFVPATKTPSQPGIMSFAGMHSALSRSATAGAAPEACGVPACRGAGQEDQHGLAEEAQ